MKRLIAGPLRPIFRRAKNSLRALAYAGKGRDCPVCGKSSRKFLPFGRIPREEAQCPACGALERHRLLWLYLLRKTNLFDGHDKKMLHVAPEPVFADRLSRILGKGYLSADLLNPDAMIRMDICDIDWPDQSFDVIYCSHVLEHVEDDRRAMAEFRRVLREDGWAILLVPIFAERTFEDPTVTEPADRLRVFGQEDHVRIYGPDYVDRLRDAGFTVDTIRAEDFLSRDEIERSGINEQAGDIFLCRKA